MERRSREGGREGGGGGGRRQGGCDKWVEENCVKGTVPQ